MALHANATTCPNCRRVMIRQVIEQDQPVAHVAAEFGTSTRTLFKWLRRYRQEGEDGLEDRVSAPRHPRRKYPPPSKELEQALFATLHQPPRHFGFNRTTWRLRDLISVLKQKGHSTNEPTVSRLIHDAGYRWRKARVALTSNDPNFREKVDRVKETLARLMEDEAFFSIDEFGPFAIRLRGGRSLVAPDMFPVVPQWQKSRGSLILTAALELSSNQITHFYSKKKNTVETIRMLETLSHQYGDRRRLFATWDAAPWHRSARLFEFLSDHNAEAPSKGIPTIEIAPLPARAQFLNVIESVFSGMARAIIHNSNYQSADEVRGAIDEYFEERNKHYRRHPRRAGKKIWGRERTPSEFSPWSNHKDPRYR